MHFSDGNIHLAFLFPFPPLYLLCYNFFFLLIYLPPYSFLSLAFSFLPSIEPLIYIIPEYPSKFIPIQPVRTSTDHNIAL